MIESEETREELLRRLLLSKKKTSSQRDRRDESKDYQERNYDYRSSRKSNNTTDHHKRKYYDDQRDDYRDSNRKYYEHPDNRRTGKMKPSQDEYKKEFEEKGESELSDSTSSIITPQIAVVYDEIIQTKYESEKNPVVSGKGRWESSDEDEDHKITKENIKKSSKISPSPLIQKLKSVDDPDNTVDIDQRPEIIRTISNVKTSTNFTGTDIIEINKNKDLHHVHSSLSLSELTVDKKSPNNEIDAADITSSDNNVLTVVGNETTADSTETVGESTQPKPHNPLLSGCRSVDVYQRIKYIDQGTYGTVFLARCKETKELVALKQVKLGKDAARHGFPVTAIRETNILLALRHPNIVQVKEMVTGSTTDKVFMVMEFMENDLKSCLAKSGHPLRISEVKRLMLQLLQAVEHMHYYWYIHRDLKTSNILYSNKGKLAVCDFGMARKYGSPLVPYTFEVITLWYRPPELLLGAKVYSTAVDMWSVGCIFAEMLTRKPLFDGKGEAEQVSKIFKVLGAPTNESWPGYASLPLANYITSRLPTRNKLRDMFPRTAFAGGVCLSDTGFDLLDSLLTPDPSKRISAADAVKHSWFTEDPQPQPEELMPVFSSSHETES